MDKDIHKYRCQETHYDNVPKIILKTDIGCPSLIAAYAATEQDLFLKSKFSLKPKSY